MQNYALLSSQSQIHYALQPHHCVCEHINGTYYLLYSSAFLELVVIGSAML